MAFLKIGTTSNRTTIYYKNNISELWKKYEKRRN